VNHIQKNTKILISSDEINLAVNKVALELNTDYKEKDPIILCVVKGAIIFTGQLLPKLDFKMELDYIHATRYHGQEGKEIQWKYKPDINFNGRNILLIDDILDIGITLREITAFCFEKGAESVKSVVLLEKNIKRPKSSVQNADYSGIKIDNHFVFGYGLDLDGYWRNTKDIFYVEDN
tara:strand:- start:525 stop:1058 length:534 start_codon:yes stop_codon:yes gene_type:complete